jgi:hypothetical protein
MGSRKKIMKIIPTTFEDVEIVKYAYCKLISEVFGRPIRLKPIREGGKVYQNCKAVLKFCERKSITPNEYMLVMYRVYDLGWVLRTFKKPYPPFTLITCAKILEKAEGLYPDETKNVLSEETIEKYFTLLNGIDKDTALELVTANFCGVDGKLKEALLRRIKEKNGA